MIIKLALYHVEDVIEKNFLQMSNVNIESKMKSYNLNIQYKVFKNILILELISS